VLDHALDALASAQPADVPAVGIASAWRFVATLGFTPATDRCAVCHVDLPDDPDAAFSHAAGGCVCDRCSGTVLVSRSLPAAARRAIAAWTSGRDASPGDDRARRAHVRLLREFLHHHVSDGRTLVAFEAWESGLAAPR
jgi:DNA repair protein RecO (recombination protein O)